MGAPLCSPTWRHRQALPLSQSGSSLGSLRPSMALRNISNIRNKQILVILTSGSSTTSIASSLSFSLGLGGSCETVSITLHGRQGGAGGGGGFWVVRSLRAASAFSFRVCKHRGGESQKLRLTQGFPPPFCNWRQQIRNVLGELGISIIEDMNAPVRMGPVDAAEIPISV